MNIDKLMALEKAKRFIVGLICVPKCVGCGERISIENLGEGEHVLCKDCRKKWERSKVSTCPICSRQYTECTCPTPVLADAGCGILVSIVPYDPEKSTESVSNRMIYRIKNEYDSEVNNFLANELSYLIINKMYSAGIDDAIVTYSPRSRDAIGKYGHDQSEKLAKRIASKIGCKCERLIERRKIPGEKTQKNLNEKERIKNAERSFLPSRTVSRAKGKFVVIVDDVVTTGSSLAAATRIVKDAGAMSVMCVTVAKTRQKNRIITKKQRGV